MSSTGRGTTSFERPAPLPFAPSPEPFDLRAAKSRRISAESAPGLTPIRLVSQLFDRILPIERLWRRSDSVPSQLTVASTSSSEPAWSSWMMPRSSTRRPGSGPRANQASKNPRRAPAAGGTKSKRCCLHRKRGRTVSQGRLLIVELWASQAPGSHGSQLERTSRQLPPADPPVSFGQCFTPRFTAADREGF